MKIRKKIIALIAFAALAASCAQQKTATPAAETADLTAVVTTVATTTYTEATLPESTLIPPEEPKTFTLSADGEAILEQAKKDMSDAIATVNESRQINEPITAYKYPDFTAYDSLDDEHKELYDELYSSILKLYPCKFDESKADYMKWDKAYSAIVEDHPNMQCYVHIDIQSAGTTLCYSIPDGSGGEITDPGAVRDKMNTFDAVCYNVVKMIPKDYSTYDKYRVLAHFVSNRLTYNYDIDNNVSFNDYTAYTSVMGGKSVCVGYTEGYEYLCRCAGLYCGTVYGTVENEGHAWNAVALQDGTYHVDVCWCDNMSEMGLNWNDYFMLTQEQILESRIVGNDFTATGKKNFRDS